MNFVFVSLQRINTDRESTSTSLARELSKNHQVLYINPPLDRKTYYLNTSDTFLNSHKRSAKQNNNHLFELSVNLWALNTKTILESINWIPLTAVFEKINWLNNYRFSQDIKKALVELNIKDFILINDKDIFRSFHLKELLKPKLYVYLDRDYTIGFGYWKRHGVSLEPKLMAKSDAVVCNSLDFTRNALKYNANSFYIGNGCDIHLFNPNKSYNLPKELKVTSRPIIGYVGALHSKRLDIDLIIKIATYTKNWSVVLIGEEDENFMESDLHNLPNVHFLGKIHKSDIPPYLKHFDVCVNPQVINEITIGNFPLKIVEYLAMGKPVVAMATNTMNEVFSGQTYLANSTQGFIEKIEQALIEDNPGLQKERIKFASNYSWENVTKILLNSIQKVLK